MELRRGDPIYPVRPRWSIGIRDNWSGEAGWFEFRSMRDVILRIGAVMSGLSVVTRPLHCFLRAPAASREG
jgi:hypothetical protein